MIAATILMWLYGFLTGSSSCTYSELTFQWYSRRHKDFTWGVNYKRHFLPNSMEVEILTLGCGLFNIDFSFYNIQNNGKSNN